MRTHPDIDLMTARCRLAETCAFFGCVTATMVSCTLEPITSTIRESIKYNLLYASACVTIRNVAPARKSDFDRLV